MPNQALEKAESVTNVFQSGSPSVDNDTFSATINHPFYGKLTVSVNIENLYIDETTAKFIYDGANLTFTFEIKQTTGSATSRRLTVTTNKRVAMLSGFALINSLESGGTIGNIGDSFVGTNATSFTWPNKWPGGQEAGGAMAGEIVAFRLSGGSTGLMRID